MPFIAGSQPRTSIKDGMESRQQLGAVLADLRNWCYLLLLVNFCEWKLLVAFGMSFKRDIITTKAKF